MAVDCFPNRRVKFRQCIGLRRNAAAIWIVPRCHKHIRFFVLFDFEFHGRHR